MPFAERNLLKRIAISTWKPSSISRCEGLRYKHQPHVQRRHFAKGGSDSEAAAPKKQSPSKKKQQSSGPSEENLKENKTYNMVLAALDAPMTKPPPASQDEMERRFHVGRSYVVGRFNEHNQLNHELACKIKMKNHAIKMLPKNTLLRKAALETDDVGPPKWRHIPVWTPPIPGFHPGQFIDEDEKDES